MQLSKSLKIQIPLLIPGHQKWLSYEILGDKTIKHVQIDPQTTDIWSKKLNLTLLVSELGREGVTFCDIYLISEKLRL